MKSTIDKDICVVCFDGSDSLMKISCNGSGNLDSCLRDMKYVINKHLWLMEVDGERCQICSECWQRLRAFHEFYCKIEELHSQNNVNKEKMLISKQDTDVILKFEENISNTMENFIKEESNSSSIPPDSPRTPENELVECEEIEDVETQNTNTKTCEKSNVAVDEDNDCGSSSPIINKIYKKPITQVKIEDVQIREYCKMICEVCFEKLESFLELKRHYRNKHKMKGHVTCCNRQFKKRHQLVDHISRHVNPCVFFCKTCDKTFATRSGLKIHMDNHKPEETRAYKCDRCPRSFTRQYQLKVHVSLHAANDDKKFHCVECDRLFATKAIHQNHITRVHIKSNVFICDICAKVLRSKHTFLRHRKEHEEGVQLEKVQCKLCGSWHKNETNLKKHIKRHEEANEIHICNICGKQAPNKGALRSHQRYVHIIERNQKCTICDKAFKKARALKEHMATHTGEVLYQCLFCPKTFNSSANMHAHKKKQHKSQWEDQLKYNIN